MGVPFGLKPYWSPSLVSDWLMKMRKSYYRPDARQRGDEFPEPGAANLEIAVLIERGASRRQQDYGIGKRRGLRIARRVDDRDIERFGNLMRHAFSQRFRKFLRGLADQIGLADTRKIFGKTA